MFFERVRMSVRGGGAGGRMRSMVIVRAPVVLLRLRFELEDEEDEEADEAE